MVEHLTRRALRDDGPLVEGDETVRDRRDESDVVLDHQQRGIEATAQAEQQRAEGLGLSSGDARCSGSVGPMVETGRRATKKAETHDALRNAAFKLFAEKGFAATRVADIVAICTVSERTFFRYFASKEDVALAGVQAWLDELFLAIEALPDTFDPIAAIGAVLRQADGGRFAFGPDQARDVVAYLGDLRRAVRRDGVVALRRQRQRPMDAGPHHPHPSGRRPHQRPPSSDPDCPSSDTFLRCPLRCPVGCRGACMRQTIRVGPRRGDGFRARRPQARSPTRSRGNLSRPGVSGSQVCRRRVDDPCQCNASQRSHRRRQPRSFSPGVDADDAYPSSLAVRHVRTSSAKEMHMTPDADHEVIT